MTDSKWPASSTYFVERFSHAFSTKEVHCSGIDWFAEGKMFASPHT